MGEPIEAEQPQRPNFSFQYAAFHPESTTLGRAVDDAYRQYNFDLCRALDMTKLSCVLGDMVENRWIDRRVAELFHLQAGALLAMMTSENNRLYAQHKDSPNV